MKGIRKSRKWYKKRDSYMFYLKHSSCTELNDHEKRIWVRKTAEYFVTMDLTDKNENDGLITNIHLYDKFKIINNLNVKTMKFIDDNVIDEQWTI